MFQDIYYCQFLYVPCYYHLLQLHIKKPTHSQLISFDKNYISLIDVAFSPAPKIKGSGETGVLYVVEPLDACSPLMNVAGITKSPFALIIRGKCSFEDKVRTAQNAGFKAAIVYDSEDSEPLVESNILSPC